MTNSDIPIIRQRVKELQYISPVLSAEVAERKNVVRGERNGAYLVKGCYPEYDLIEKSNMIYGRYVNDIDIAEKRKVCVIGERIYEVLFQPGEDPVGKQIRVNGIYFQVIGVARSTSGVSIGGQTAETVVLPFSTMQQAFNQGNIIHFVAATANHGTPVKIVQDQITAILKQRRLCGIIAFLITVATAVFIYYASFDVFNKWTSKSGYIPFIRGARFCVKDICRWFKRMVSTPCCYYCNASNVFQHKIYGTTTKIIP